MAHIVIFAIGTRGDIQPFMALALGLQQAGYTVCLAAPPNFRSFIEGYNIPFTPVGDDWEAVVQNEEAVSYIESGSMIQGIRFRLNYVNKVFHPTNMAAWQACQKADLIIYPKEDFILGYSFAQKLGIPCIEACLYPATATKTYRLLRFQALFEQIHWQAYMRGRAASFHRTVLGLQPFPFWGPARQKKKARIPILYGYSSVLFPVPPDWPDYAHVTGSWFLNMMQSWEPTPDLIHFLKTGPKPVYVGFGSMANRDTERTLAVVLEALAMAGQRGVLVSGWGGLGADVPLPDHVMWLENASFDWLFPRMAAVVHHGGVGTTTLGLRAGVPSVIIPHIADQFFWGECVARIGAGPTPIPRQKLNAEQLAQAITTAINDDSIQRQATSASKLIQVEDGIGRAITVIEHQLARSSLSHSHYEQKNE